jgi:DNA-binding NtrC family response regulator
MEAGSTLRVLIADDERVIADTLGIILRTNGYETQSVYSGETAVEAAKQMKPDILITDVVMGKMNGIEAAKLIQGQLPDCRVILFSGNASTWDMIRDSRTKGQHYELLTKPMHPAALLQQLTHGQSCAAH